MSNRTVKHSSRYKGPAGDSRPAAEIFAGAEARSKQMYPYVDRLEFAMRDLLKNATLTSFEGRLDAIRMMTIDFLTQNDLDFAERARRG